MYIYVHRVSRIAKTRFGITKIWALNRKRAPYCSIATFYIKRVFFLKKYIYMV